MQSLALFWVHCHLILALGLVIAQILEDEIATNRNAWPIFPREGCSLALEVEGLSLEARYSNRPKQLKLVS